MKRIGFAFLLIWSLVRPICALTPGDLSAVKFEQHPGQLISANIAFRDETNRSVKLGEFFGKRPIILLPGYYRCPMLCPMINDGLINTLENLQAGVGKDFEVIEFSIDPNEKADAAAARKALSLRRYGRSGSESGWHCLVGDATSIAQLTQEIGFRYVYDPQIRQYAHASGIIILTPAGKISRYIFGATFEATELRDALAAAKEERSTSVLSQLFLLCYHYNPITGKYGGMILSVLRMASLAFLGLLAWWVFLMTRRAASENAQTG